MISAFQASPQVAKKRKIQRKQNNLLSIRIGNLSKRRTTLCQILERTAPVTFQFFTGAIEKIAKLYQESIIEKRVSNFHMPYQK